MVSISPLLAVALTAVIPSGAAAAEHAERFPAPATAVVPAGPFIAGSDRAEREAAYRLDEAAYGHSVTREGRWYEGEPPPTRIETGAYEITVTPITNAQYSDFADAVGHPVPDVDRGTATG